MKNILVLTFLLLNNIFGHAQLGAMSRFVEATPVYKYTNSENIDVFEVTAYGTNSIEELGKNAKFKLINMLVLKGYNGIKNFRPISNNNNTEKIYQDKIEKILDNSDIISSDYKKVIKPIYISKRKIYTKTFIIGINYQKLQNELQKY